MKILCDPRATTVSMQLDLGSERPIFSLKLGPYVEEDGRKYQIQDKCLRWMKKFSFFNQLDVENNFLNHRFDFLATTQFKNFDLQIVMVAAKLMIWYFYFDDFIEHNAEKKTTFLALSNAKKILAGQNLHGFTETMLSDLVNDLDSYGKMPYLRKKFFSRLGEYVDGCEKENLFSLSQPKNIDVEHFIKEIRLKTVGVYPCFDLMALGLGIKDDQAMRLESSSIKEIEDIAVKHSILTNDLFGLERDLAQNNPNIILYEAKEKKISLSKVVAKSEAEANDLFDRFEELRAKEISPAFVSDYTRYIGYFLRSIVDWYLTSDRYRDSLDAIVRK